MSECQGRLTNNMAESDHFFLLIEVKNGPSVLQTDDAKNVDGIMIYRSIRFRHVR